MRTMLSKWTYRLYSPVKEPKSLELWKSNLWTRGVVISEIIRLISAMLPMQRRELPSCQPENVLQSQSKKNIQEMSCCPFNPWFKTLRRHLMNSNRISTSGCHQPEPWIQTLVPKDDRTEQCTTVHWNSKTNFAEDELNCTALRLGNFSYAWLPSCQWPCSGSKRLTHWYSFQNYQISSVSHCQEESLAPNIPIWAFPPPSKDSDLNMSAQSARTQTLSSAQLLRREMCSTRIDCQQSQRNSDSDGQQSQV